MSNSELAVRDSQEVSRTRLSSLEDSLFSKELAPHYIQLATRLASSEMVPKSFRGKPQDLFICWAMGYQIGMSPEQSMQCIAVINGKPAMWGDDMLALCMVHKDFEDILEEPIMKDGNVFGFTCTVKRKGRADKVNKFDLNDAKKAKLIGKQGPWSDYPERMLKLRARGFCLRDAFPDALKGIKSREEVEDYIDAEYSVAPSTAGSRVERLKEDIINKQGVSNADIIAGVVETEEHKVDFQDSTQSEESQALAQAGEKADNPYTEIKRLIEETGFAPERLVKALKYYEVESIDQLGYESAKHFLMTLNKGL